MKVWNGMTGAGNRRPPKEPAKAWACPQGHENPGYATRCLTLGCNVVRDEKRAA